MYETKTKFSILKKGNHFFLSNYFQEAKRGSTILQESGFLVELGILRGWRAGLPSVGEGLDFLLLTDWHFSASGRWAEFPSDSGAGTLLIETR